MILLILNNNHKLIFIDNLLRFIGENVMRLKLKYLSLSVLAAMLSACGGGSKWYFINRKQFGGGKFG